MKADHQPRSEREGQQAHGDMQHEHHAAMGERGVTRMQMAMVDGQMEMTPEDRQEMLRQHHAQTLWVPLLVVLLGVWLITSPFALGYSNPDLAGSGVARITAERSLPEIAARGMTMTWSDVISGILLVVLSLIWLMRPRRIWAPWAACFVGIWLLFAPLLFWAPTAAAYANDTLIGVLVIALTILIPGMPGMILIMKMAPAIFGTQGTAADSSHLVGALVVTLAVIAMAEVTRAARFLNILSGIWIIAAPWLLSGAGMAATWTNAIVGVILILLSLPKGRVRERYGGWDRYIV